MSFCTVVQKIVDGVQISVHYKKTFCTLSNFLCNNSTKNHYHFITFYAITQKITVPFDIFCNYTKSYRKG